MLHTAVHPSLPATAVTHTVSGNFSRVVANDSSVSKEVIAIRQNHLSLYSATQAPESSPLILISEVSLNAPPIAVATCNPSGSQVDIIVLLFDDFHISFIQYNPLSTQFDTVALVQLDDRESIMERCPLDAILRVDPSGTYVAVLSKRKELFFFPILSKVSKAEAMVATAAPIATEAEAPAEAAAPKVALDAWGDEDDEDEDAEDAGQHKGTSQEKNEEDKEPAPKSTVLTMEDEVLSIGHITHIQLGALKATIRNIRDIQFVESAGEPLIAFLYEKQPTWAGRVKLLQLRSRTIESHMLTCAIVWIKVTFATSSTPKMLPIGDVENLPFNLTHMVPVPPFQQVPSAVLCFGRNTILHVSTKNGYGAFLNTNGREEVHNTRAPAMVYESIKWSDRTQESSLDLVKTNLNFANCVAIPEIDAYGMHLVVITEEEGTVVDITVAAEGYAVSSFACHIVMTGCFASCWSALGVEHYYFMGSCRGDSRVVACGRRTPLRVIQSFVGLCPIHDVTAIDDSGRLHQEEHLLHQSIEDSPYADLFHNVTIDPEPIRSLTERRAVQDLALCTGYGASGSVSILRNSMRDNIIRSEEVNAVSVFFLESTRARQARERKRPRDAEGEDAAPTAASQGGASAHLLMTGRNFTILFEVRSDSVHQVRGTVFNTSARTIFAAELDWFAALLQVTETELRIVTADGKRTIQSLSFLTAMPDQADNVVARSAFLIPEKKSVCVHFTNGNLVEFNLEDTSAAIKHSLCRANVRSATYWSSCNTIVVMEGSGSLVFLGAGNTVASEFPNFSVLPPVALDGVETPLAKLSDRMNKESLPEVTHLYIYQHPAQSGVCDRPEGTLAMITNSGELLTYNIFPVDEHGPRRLVKRLHHFLDIKAEREAMETVEQKKIRLARERAEIEEDTLQTRHCSERLVSFTAIGGCEGIYACGQHPAFLTFDEQRSELVLTRHKVNGAVRGFSSFSSRTVDGGYVYCCDGYVFFATMQAFGTSLGNGWWMRRIPLGATPHKIVYSPSARHCYVITSTMQPYSPKRASFDVQLQVKYEEDGTQSISVEKPMALPPLSAENGAPVPLNERYCIKFFSCGDWECTDEYPLEENEKVMSAECVDIPRDASMDAAAHAAVAPVCILGTAFPLGEDVTTRGRLIILASKHEGRRSRMRLLHSEPQKGPVTAVTGIQGNIAASVGGTIRVLRYDYMTLKMETLAMLYAGAYVTSMVAFRNYIVYGDLYHSVAMARFSGSNHTLTVLGKDTNNVSVVHCDMLYNNGSFGIVVSDADRNIAMMGYAPRVQEVDGADSKKLLESILTYDGEYRIPGGSLVKMLRFKSLSRAASTGVYITNYGELGFLVPLSDQINRTGQWVAQRLQNEVPMAAGLAPRMFLGFKQDDAKLSLKGKEKMLHTPLLNELFRLDTRTRKAVAAAALTQLDRALNVGVTIYSETCLF